MSKNRVFYKIRKSFQNCNEKEDGDKCIFDTVFLIEIPENRIDITFIGVLRGNRHFGNIAQKNT